MDTTTSASPRRRPIDTRETLPSAAGVGPTVVRTVLGLALLTAAALKVYDQSLEPLGRTSVLGSARLQMAVVAIELLLGGWLVIGPASWALWCSTITFFTGLAGASLYLGVIGQASCGCFGQLRVSPWYTFALDVAALLALLRWRPTFAGASVLSRNSLRHGALVVAGAAAILAMAVGGLTLWYGSPAQALTQLRGESVTVDPPTADLGEGGAGEWRSVTVRLTNNTSHPILIYGGTSDCSCLATEDLPITLPARETMALRVHGKLANARGIMSRTYIMRTDDTIEPVLIAGFVGRVR